MDHNHVRERLSKKSTWICVRNLKNAAYIALMHQLSCRFSCCEDYLFRMMSSASTLALSTDDESDSEGSWLHPGVSPPGDAVLQLDDESSSVQESGCMLSSKSTQTEKSICSKYKTVA